MDEFRRYNSGDVRIEKVNLVRATMNEAQEIRDNILEDYLVFKKIIVDLSDCEYIDSTFFGALVFAYKHLKSKGAHIKLVMSNSFMRRTFIFRDIEKIFDVHNSLREALNAYETDKKAQPIYN